MESRSSGINTVALAFMGDAVYEQFIREFLLRSGAVPGNRADLLHRKAASYVCASAQARSVRSLIDDGYLTEEEIALVKRARNHRSATKPKNADAVEYKWATAFEALLGELYLSGSLERLKEIMEKTI
jgi:ribonuclease-3 family protein